ncbi:hypothetical protein AVEN_188601-1 [Araneus ventricosus]|uniref:Uncharacterized protein n=1 Tax=Araneus ventricosus TaxID=182803 RepID=A0A4Y2E809_ARAVE|nr:hypothetical protein AVEN_188601-1 [Araneus ventricosus]
MFYGARAIDLTRLCQTQVEVVSVLHYLQENGGIERWHRILKAVIIFHTSVHRMPVLPAVLLGLRAFYKEDLQSLMPRRFMAKTLPCSALMHS